MTNPWWQDFGKAVLVLTGLALALGYQDELRTSGRQVSASVKEFAGSLSEREPVRVEPSPPKPVEMARVVAPETECRHRVTYIVVRQPTCRPVVRSCR